MIDKEKLLQLLQHEVSICNKLDAEYRDEYFEKVEAGEKEKARCLDDLRTRTRGERYGLKIAIEYIESMGE